MGSYKKNISFLLMYILFIFSIIFLYNAVSGEGFRGGGGHGGIGRYGGRATGAGVTSIGATHYYGGHGWRSNYYNNAAGGTGGGYGWFPWLWYPWNRSYSEEPAYYVPTNKVLYYPSSSYNYPYNNLEM